MSNVVLAPVGRCRRVFVDGGGVAKEHGTTAAPMADAMMQVISHCEWFHPVQNTDDERNDFLRRLVRSIGVHTPHGSISSSNVLMLL